MLHILQAARKWLLAISPRLESGTYGGFDVDAKLSVIHWPSQRLRGRVMFYSILFADYRRLLSQCRRLPTGYVFQHR